MSANTTSAMTEAIHVPQAQTLNPLTLPLQGRQVIEASAGTGKTWTLAALYLRLVLGHQREAPLLPPQILVMTFTDAATAELRERIRQRLSQAAAYFDASAQDRSLPTTSPAPDPFLVSLRDSFDNTLWPRCALQLHTAAEWMDEAAIYTLHAWSRRMLSQHALDSRTLFEQSHLEQAQDLQRSLLQDYWRTWFYPLSAEELSHLSPFIGQAPDDLLATVQALWKAQERSPHLTPAPSQSPPQILQTHMAWQAEQAHKTAQAKALWSDAVWQALQHAIERKTLKGRGINATNFAKWLQALKSWAEQDAPIKPDVLVRFSTDFLVQNGWADASGFASFAAVQDVLAHQTLAPETGLHVSQHAAYSVGEAYQAAKAERAAFDFSDLLQNLHHAVMAEDGRLAGAIREQYPVALVDEFQDTDPWQYGTLHRIYAVEACTAANAWVMIGDPKQAIYSFRGADLGTYLQARSHALALQADALHTLSGNHRSSAGLVNAVNHVFTQIDGPFFSTARQTPASAQEQIAFIQVSAEGNVPPLLDANGQALAAMTVWHIPCDAQAISAPQHMRQMAQSFAEQMAALLNQGTAQPGDMAVLVRGQAQAEAMRAALQSCGIPSVYLSDRAKVYTSPEALDLWRLLRAVASPRQTAWMRAAVGSRLWGLSLEDVLALTQAPDQSAWEQLLAQAHHWQQLWQQHGVLAMLHHWLHSQGVAQRLLAMPEGERTMSNLLHLGELLQHAAQGLQGEQALVRFLGEQIHTPGEGSEAQKMRLETDAQCVQVVTYHKSKGLQYPLVFVPFAGSFRTEKLAQSKDTKDAKDAPDDDSAELQETSSLEEDMRLLYVALTRAQRGLWLGLAETRNDLSGDAAKDTLKQSAVSRLLKRQTRGDLAAQLHALWGHCPDITISPLPECTGTRYQAPALTTPAQDALTPTRAHHTRWWTASFSAITRGLVAQSKRDEAVADAITDAAPTTAAPDDALGPTAAPSERSAPLSDWQHFPAGARYGTLLHDLLEWQALNHWPAANPQAPAWAQQAWQDLLARKAAWLQLDAAQTAQLGPWLKAVLQTPLPLKAQETQAGEQSSASAHSQAPATPDLVLSALTEQQLWPEMEFNLEVPHLATQTLDQQIQTHIFPGVPRPALPTRLMQGMLTGSMDLVLQHAGRYWVVDYKSNKLPSYDPASLQAAILHKRYEVQYVLYTLALHRLLKVRLPNYDYAQHMGGAVYVFLRGINQDGAGVHPCCPPQGLIEALDQWMQVG